MGTVHNLRDAQDRANHQRQAEADSAARAAAWEAAQRARSMAAHPAGKGRKG